MQEGQDGGMGTRFHAEPLMWQSDGALRGRGGKQQQLRLQFAHILVKIKIKIRYSGKNIKSDPSSGGKTLQV